MTETWAYEIVPLPDGRQAEALTYGRGRAGTDRARTLVFHSGTPGGLVPRSYLAEVCDRFDLQLVHVGRPGYGLSSPRPGRVAADVAEDIAAVLDHLGVETFVTMGCSGGGPHAIACAALLPERCLAAAPVVSPAPIDAQGLDYYVGMAPSNVEEWKLAEQGREAVGPWLEQSAVGLKQNDVEEFASQYADGFPPMDLALVRTGFGEIFEASTKKALSTGVEGWLEDDLMLVAPWGFELGAITTPVTVWAGRQDRMVSSAHSVWLADAIPGADLHVLGEHGHLSVQVAALPDIVEDLLRRAGH